MTNPPGPSGSPNWPGPGSPGHQPQPPAGGQGGRSPYGDPTHGGATQGQVSGQRGSGPSPHQGIGGQPSAWPGGQQAQLPQEKGFLGALLDLNFNHLVTPKIIRLFYVLALLLVTFSALIVLGIGLWIFQLRNGWLLGLIVMGSTPFIWLFEALLVRILMEAVVVRFKGVEYLRVIKDKP